MADCLTTTEIEGLLADSLSPTDKARAEGHLATWDKCRQDVERGRADNELLGKIKRTYQAETLSKRDRPVESHARPTPPAESIEGYETLREVHRGGRDLRTGPGCGRAQSS